METEWIPCKAGENGFGPEQRAGIARAAELLRRGELVGMPTETVYGLAANALDADAVADIFRAKGRPQDNPLIVHVASAEWLPRFVQEVTPEAERLMEAFWPGPLTIIMKKKPVVPDIVSAGLPTAAFRCPSHPVAHALLEAADIPLAAPSANISGRPSPTRAEHVLHDLGGKIAAILDGGSCGVGLESTVVTVGNGGARILRPGGVTPEQLRLVLAHVEVDRAVLHQLEAGLRAASPGMKYKHYAPKAAVTIVRGTLPEVARYVDARKGPDVAVLCFEGEEEAFSAPCVTYGTAGDAETQAHALFDALRALDRTGASTVYARCPEQEGVGLAVYNRLLRAAGFSVVDARRAGGGERSDG